MLSSQFHNQRKIHERPSWLLCTRVHRLRMMHYRYIRPSCWDFVNTQFISVTEHNLDEVKSIYDWFIANSTATFHTEPITHDQLKTFLFVGDPLYRSYLILHNSAIAGYCFLTKYKDRPAYRRTAEVTLYLRPEFQGKGLGTAALQRLISDARQNGLKTLLAIITGGNAPSIALFTKAGFTKCAHFRNVGEKFNQVLDVVGYQLEL